MKSTVVGSVILITALLSFHFGQLYCAQKRRASEVISDSKFIQLEYALLAYYDDHHTFPPSKYQKSQGDPTHSWRVLLMPYLDSDSAKRFQFYNFSEEEIHKDIKEAKTLKNCFDYPFAETELQTDSKIIYENLSRHDNVAEEIFSPPPELI